MISSARFNRIDDSDDALFYQAPRLVQHIDDGFIGHLQALMHEIIAPQATILDLMSSWVSHLPKSLAVGDVVGLGMNEVELAANPQLSRYTVQNLNQNPILPYADQSFDVVLNTVSIQYVTRPLELMPEIARILKPNGSVIISFSNRMFPTKAVTAWREGSDEDHVALVQGYFQQTQGLTNIRVIRKVSAVQGVMTWFLPSADPLYAVIGQKVNS